ncbi:MAG: methionine adenosyltransferase [Candidatus Brockarchaeota archaeon]|nr:methionine adenosyltransferase [Candidatus Brockarchaeota archaeon]MBO3809824.1 methionine adenosyltransferase [Candidatus Brockarchaeota archaeon]
MAINVNQLRTYPVPKQRIEIVERKGLGHPDTISDMVMNELSVELCRLYLKEFNRVLHYNLDKSLLVAGESETRFGGGVVRKPMKLIFGDRATYRFDGKELPIEELAVDSAKNWFRRNLRFVDPDKHVSYEVQIGRSAANLADIFKRGGEFLGANDTSAAVGYAPLSQLENLVLGVEQHLNSRDFKKEFEETGEDVKVMGYRIDSMVDLTIAMSYVDRFVDSEEAYFRSKKEVVEHLKTYIEDNYDFKKVSITLNSLDTRGRGENGIYLTVTGTSAEAGDSGQVGRGNRVNGVIALLRPAGSEAAAGKNPVSHVGKIYNLLSFKIANDIIEKVDGVEEVYVWLLSQIGIPVNKPKLVSVQAILEEGLKMEVLEKPITQVVEESLSDDSLRSFINDLIEGKLRVC